MSRLLREDLLRWEFWGSVDDWILRCKILKKMVSVSLCNELRTTSTPDSCVYVLHYNNCNNASTVSISHSLRRDQLQKSTLEFLSKMGDSSLENSAQPILRWMTAPNQDTIVPHRGLGSRFFKVVTSTKRELDSLWGMQRCEDCWISCCMRPCTKFSIIMVSLWHLLKCEKVQQDCGLNRDLTSNIPGFMSIDCDQASHNQRIAWDILRSHCQSNNSFPCDHKSSLHSGDEW